MPAPGYFPIQQKTDCPGQFKFYHRTVCKSSIKIFRRNSSLIQYGGRLIDQALFILCQRLKVPERCDIICHLIVRRHPRQYRHYSGEGSHKSKRPGSCRTFRPHGGAKTYARWRRRKSSRISSKASDSSSALSSITADSHALVQLIISDITAKFSAVPSSSHS